MDRHLRWEGCFNTRDLGGIPTADGRTTRAGGFVRSDAVDQLTPAGWAALEAYGVRTVVDLRNADERRPDLAPRPASVTTLQLPLDGTEDREFWDEWGDRRHGTPLYYRPFLDHFPQHVAGILAAVAEAGPGGILFHCRVGRDRTGLLTLLLLGLAGAVPEAAADDFELSTRQLTGYFAAHGEPDQAPAIERVLSRAGTTVREQIMSLLTSVDAAEYLRSGGLAAASLTALRARLR